MLIAQRSHCRYAIWYVDRRGMVVRVSLSARFRTKLCLQNTWVNYITKLMSHGYLWYGVLTRMESLLMEFVALSALLQIRTTLLVHWPRASDELYNWPATRHSSGITKFGFGSMIITDRSNFDMSVTSRPDGPVRPIVITARPLYLTRLCRRLMSDPMVLKPASVVLYTSCYKPSSTPLRQSLHLLSSSSPSLPPAFDLSSPSSTR
jgi:hypothetical protein